MPQRHDHTGLQKLLYSKSQDENDHKYTKQCIASLAYDDAKRDQFYYKQIIKDGFHHILGKNSPLVQALDLHRDKLCIGEVAMKFGQVDVEKYLIKGSETVEEEIEGIGEQREGVKRGEILFSEHTDMLLLLSGTAYFERAAPEGEHQGQDEEDAADSSECSSSESSDSSSSGKEERRGRRTEGDGLCRQETVNFWKQTTARDDISQTTCLLWPW